ncbi:MAG TPA: 4Fe-4S binding protein [Candidatus Bathyarchaeia archaeon]|nr:4Fe-4S binding protein [Candidatus Bathyarchaeia archaeon]
MTVYFNGLESKFTDKITSHVRSNWPEATIYADNDASPNTDTPIALVIGKPSSPSDQTKALLRETIEVINPVSLEEILFRVNAKLGKLTKSDKAFATKETSPNQVMSRREFFQLGLPHNSHNLNDLPIVSTDSCEAKFGCSKCVDACPSPGALKIENDSVTVSNEYCIRCGLCAGVCPVAAIQIPRLSEDAYQGLLNAIKHSSAPTKALAITCDERNITPRPWMDIEEVPGIGVMGVRQIAIAAASIDVLIVHCGDGQCAAKENAKHALNLISSLSGTDGPILAYMEGNVDSAKLDVMIKSAQPCDKTFRAMESPWKDYVNSLNALSRGQTLAAGLGLTNMIIAESCTLCNACVESCPHQALAIEQENLNFTSEECTGCGLCAKICPEHSITLSQMSGPIKLATRTVYRDEMIKCARCNTPYVSAKMFRKVCAMLPGSEEVIKLCPKCRQTEIYEKVFRSGTSS